MPLIPSDLGGFGSGFGSGGFITPEPVYTPQPVTTQPAAPPVQAQPLTPQPTPVDTIPYQPETPSFFLPPVQQPVTTQPVTIQPVAPPEPTPPFFSVPEIPFFSPAPVVPEPTPVPPPTDIGGYIIPDAPMIRPPDAVTGIGSDYPFTDGVPTATPTPDNGFHILPVDRVPLDPSGGYGSVPITYPDNIHYLPMPDPVPADTLPGSSPSPTPRGISPPDVPSDIGGFIPDIPNLPVTLPVSSQPAGDTTTPTDSTGGTGDTTGTTGVINKLADLMAAQFAGGGGSGGGLSALPVGIAPTQAQSSGSVLPLLLIGGLIVGGIWYFRHKKAT